jgi:hypothetical protein
VRLPTNDVPVTTPAVTSVPLTRLFADPTILPVKDVAVMTPVAVIPLTVIIPIGAINCAFS